MLLSWTMLMAGVASFASCSDDDEEDGTEMFEKYGNKKGTTVDGDDVIVSTSQEGMGQIIVYHFDGDKLVGGTYYIKYANETIAKEAYNTAKELGTSNVKLDGSVVSAPIPTDELDEYDGATKDEIVKTLNLLYK